MSMFEDEHYRWRETYFVLFDAKKRPTLDKMKKTIRALSNRYELSNLSADEEGRFESLTVLSPDDFAALDVCYLGGEEVQEQAAQLVAEMKPTLVEPGDQAKLRRIARCDGRFDVLHFEQLTDLPGEEDEQEEMLDPGAMLVVLSALAKLTDGIAVDPQSGTII